MGPNTRYDTTKPIWENRYECMVSWLGTTSPEYLKYMGTPTTGDINVDRELMNQKIHTFKTINEMVDLHRTGVTVYIVNKETIKEIYDHVQNHLRAWIVHLDHGVNVHGAPIDDLLAMEAFADTVFGVIRYDITQTEANSPFMRELSKRGFMSKSLFNNASKTIVDPDAIVDRGPKRESLSSIFKKQKIPGKRW